MCLLNALLELIIKSTDHFEIIIYNHSSESSESLELRSTSSSIKFTNSLFLILYLHCSK